MPCVIDTSVRYENLVKMPDESLSALRTRFFEVAISEASILMVHCVVDTPTVLTQIVRTVDSDHVCILPSHFLTMTTVIIVIMIPLLGGWCVVKSHQDVHRFPPFSLPSNLSHSSVWWLAAVEKARAA